jgi:pimeloyl-ACP methyl ester carboxylesterase
VDVPEDHGARQGRRVPLAFALARSRSEAPFPDAVVYLHGGPGGGAPGAIDLATEVVPGGHRDHRDVVTFDQRASSMLSSTTVRCSDLMAEDAVALARGMEDLPTMEGPGSRRTKSSRPASGSSTHRGRS